MTWDTVGKISIGEEVITRQVNRFNASEDTRTDSRIEYFEEQSFFSLCGTQMVSVRDSNWNFPLRTLMDEIAADHPGCCLVIFCRQTFKMLVSGSLRMTGIFTQLRVTLIFGTIGEATSIKM